MSLGLIIGGAIILLLASLVIVSTSKRKRTKKEKFLNPLKELAFRNQCQISHSDIWSESVIGIDDNKNQVFVIRKNAGSESEITINLSNVFRCRVSEISHTSGPKEGNIKAFDRIDLVFSHKEKSKPDVSVEFYNSNTDRLTLAGELQLAEKWCSLINRRLSSIGN